MTDGIIFILFLEICPFVKVYIRVKPRLKPSLILFGLRVKYLIGKWDRKRQTSCIGYLFSVPPNLFFSDLHYVFCFKDLNFMDTVEETELPWFLTAYSVRSIRSHMASEEERRKVGFCVPWILLGRLLQASCIYFFPWNVAAPLKMTLHIGLSI